MDKNNYTISLTSSRRNNYPNACRVIDGRKGNLSDLLLAALEETILGNGLQDKDAPFIEWSIHGLGLHSTNKTSPADPNVLSEGLNRMDGDDNG